MQLHAVTCMQVQKEHPRSWLRGFDRTSRTPWQPGYGYGGGEVVRSKGEGEAKYSEALTEGDRSPSKSATAGLPGRHCHPGNAGFPASNMKVIN